MRISDWSSDVCSSDLLEVDFVSFASLVDSLGGITIEFPNPAYDRNSGLDVQQAGPVTLDGPQALAYVRSRHLVEVFDGQDRPDATAALARSSEDRRVGQECVGTCRSRGQPLNKKKKK